MSSLLERLEQHEAVARARVEALRAELATLTERLSAEEELLSRLEITKTTVLEVLAGDDLDPNPAPHPAVAAGTGTGTGTGTGAALASASGAGAGAAMQVPTFAPGSNDAGQRLPTAYRDVVEVLVDAGMPLRAMQVCQALGAGTRPRHREGMRSKLKRLAARGWLVETEPGLFRAASGVAGALDGRRGPARPGEDELKGSSS